MHQWLALCDAERPEPAFPRQ